MFDSKEFNLKEYIKNGFILAIGNEPDYKIIIASGDWLKNGVFVESDLADIQAEIDKQHINEREV